MADKKAEILAALKSVRPLPRDLIFTLENEHIQTEIDAWIATWLGYTKDDWKDERKNQPRNDGAAIYNALHRNQVALGGSDWSSAPDISVAELADLLAPRKAIIETTCQSPDLLLPTQQRYTKLDGSVGQIVVDPSRSVNMLLETVFYQPEADLELKNIDTDPVAISLIFGTSGVGKSARVLRLFTKRFGFYLSACAGTARDMKPSSDLDDFMQKVKERCNNFKTAAANTAFVKRYVPSLVAARLCVLLHMLDSFPDLSPGQFLMTQLFPWRYFGCDVFTEITKCYRRIPVDDVMRLLLQMKKEIEQRVGHALLCCVDEAQVLCCVLPGCFYSSQSNERRPLLSPFAAAATTVSIPFIFSGTGLRMNIATEEGASSMHTSQNEYAASIATDDDVYRLFSKYIGVSYRDLARLFRGRYRFSSFLIKAFVKKSVNLGASTIGQDFDFESIVASVLQEIMELLQKRLRDVNSHFLQSNIMDFTRLTGQIQAAANAFIWSGQPAVLYEFGARTKPDVETDPNYNYDSFAGSTLFEKGFGLLEAYTRDNKSARYLRVTLAEPLVAKFAYESELISYPTFLPWNDSMLGFYTEHLYSDRFINYFREWRDIKSLVDVTRLPVGLKDFEIRIVTPQHHGGTNLLERVHTGNTVDWMNMPSAERQPIHQPLTYLRPDGIGLFEIRWKDGKSVPIGLSNEVQMWRQIVQQRKKIVGLAQWKLRNYVSLAECIYSIDKKNLGVGKNGKVAATNQAEVNAVHEFIGDGAYLRIVMVYPHEFKQITVEPRESLARQAKAVDHGIDIVISGAATATILGSDVVDFIESVKPK